MTKLADRLHAALFKAVMEECAAEANRLVLEMNAVRDTWVRRTYEPDDPSIIEGSYRVKPDSPPPAEAKRLPVPIDTKPKRA